MSADRLPRRALLAAGLAALAGLSAPRVLGASAGASAAGGSYPHRPITLWVPWPAGGATDMALRLLAELAGRQLGQPVIIENRPGGGGTMAMPVLQRAEPDGYTIAQIPQPVLRVPYTQKVLWDPIRDVTPIIQVSGVTFGILVAGKSAFHSLDDLFVYASSHPGMLTIATNGVGTSPHMVLEELFTQRGLRYIHVPYKGTAEQMIAVESGQVMVGVNSTGFAPFVDSGKLRLLVTFAAQRSPRWPRVPTLKELGWDIVAQSPWGIGGPRGMPPQVVGVLHDALRAAMLDPLFIHELAKFDQQPDYRSAADYGRWMREQSVRERLAVERLGMLRHGG